MHVYFQQQQQCSSHMQLQCAGEPIFVVINFIGFIFCCKIIAWCEGVTSVNNVPAL